MSRMPYIPTVIADFYKLSHPDQYPEGTELVYSNLTARGTRIPGVDHVVFFGLQGYILKWMVDYFNTYFFARSRQDVIREYQRFIYFTLINPGNVQGVEPWDIEAAISTVNGTRIGDLYDYGRLPITIKAVPEGTLVPLRVPVYTVENTQSKKFYWITNFFETQMSAEIWGAITNATIAHEYKKIVVAAADETCDNRDHVPFQCHGFEFRGMFGIEAAAFGGAGHLLSFLGSDTCTAIEYLTNYYLADISKEIVGTSIPATEHSVMCAHGSEDERGAIHHLITGVYPAGFASIVSDTWDFWNLVINVYPSLKTEIMARDGRVVIRPDSGDPVLIICGDPDAATEHERKGLIECLWDSFSGTVNSKGYKVLDPHIGAIYGDGITIERAREILKRLKARGFASSNIVFGLGSFTYQFNTRDTFEMAVKSTYVIINGVEKMIQKAPKTDSGTKKSAKGKLIVYKDGDKIKMLDNMNQEQYENMQRLYGDLLEPVMVDGVVVKQTTLSEIRERLAAQL